VNSVGIHLSFRYQKGVAGKVTYVWTHVRLKLGEMRSDYDKQISERAREFSSDPRSYCQNFEDYSYRNRHFSNIFSVTLLNGALFIVNESTDRHALVRSFLAFCPAIPVVSGAGDREGFA
jgi:hypothetical protein